MLVPFKVLSDSVQCFNDVYFFSPLPTDMKCVWTFMGQKRGAFVRSSARIALLPKTCSPTCPDRLLSRASSRLDIPLQGCIHAYLSSLTCKMKSSPTFHHTVGLEGHGRPFTKLLAKVRRLSPMQAGLGTDNVEGICCTGSCINSLRLWRTLPSTYLWALR